MASNLKVIKPVDAAMAEDRPAKATVRNLWADQAQYFHDHHASEEFPIYLTLSGAEARDIRVLIERNIVSLTETGGIAAADAHKVVAVEASLPNVLILQKQWTGLKIVDQNFSHIVGGNSQTGFPTGKHKKYCCACVVNLDLNCSLAWTLTAGNIEFPIFNWIRKLSLLHSTDRPGVDWCLCLTLNATINNPDELAPHIQDFLKENFQASPAFAASCQALLGDELQAAIESEVMLDLGGLTTEQQQKLLMIFVPKKIARMVDGQGWKVSTLKNLCYDAADGHAPMVTWILYFGHDNRAQVTPQTVYLESLEEILSFAGNIDADGQIIQY